MLSLLGGERVRLLEHFSSAKVQELYFIWSRSVIFVTPDIWWGSDPSSFPFRVTNLKADIRTTCSDHQSADRTVAVQSPVGQDCKGRIAREGTYRRRR